MEVIGKSCIVVLTLLRMAEALHLNLWLMKLYYCRCQFILPIHIEILFKVTLAHSSYFLKCCTSEWSQANFCVPFEIWNGYQAILFNTLQKTKS